MRDRIVAKGQITIVDLSDAKTANVYLSANQPVTQIYNTGNFTYSPNFSDKATDGSNAFNNPLIITPHLYVSGNTYTGDSDGDGHIDGETFTGNMHWKIKSYGGLTSHTWEGTSTVSLGVRQSVKDSGKDETKEFQTNVFGAYIDNKGRLIIVKNMVEFDSMVIEFDAIWHDSLTSLDSIVKAAMSFDKRSNGGSGTLAMCYIESTGDVFVPVTTGTKGFYPENIRLDAILVRGDIRDNDPHDNTSFYTKWYLLGASEPVLLNTIILDSNKNVTSYGLTPEAEALGFKLTQSNPDYATSHPVDYNSITVTPSCIQGMETFRAEVIYTGAGELLGLKFNSSNLITISDSTDPFQVVVTCDKGTTYVNHDFGNGSDSNPYPEIRADITKNGLKIAEVDRTSATTIADPDKGTYKIAPFIVSYDWAKYDAASQTTRTFADGSSITIDTTFERSRRSRSKKFNITLNDVNIKAVYFVEASIYPNIYAGLERLAALENIPTYGGNSDVLVTNDTAMSLPKHWFMYSEGEKNDYKSRNNNQPPTIPTYDD